MLKKLFILLLFMCFSCVSFDMVKSDLKVLDEISKSNIIELSTNENFTGIKKDFKIATSSEIDDSVIFNWSSSDLAVLAVNKDKCVVQRHSEDKNVTLTLQLKKGYATKTLSWTIFVPKVYFAVPSSLDELLEFKAGEQKDNVKTDFNYETNLSNKNSIYEGINVAYSTVEQDIVNLNNGNATISSSLPKNSSYTVTINAKFTSLAYPDDEVTRTTTVTIPAVLPETSNIQQEIEIEGRTLRLTYFDEFDNQEYFENDWDIGNPGYGAKTQKDKASYDQYKIDSGNPGIETPTLVNFKDGLKGYSGDRYKQPYWSPKATKLKDGNLEIQVFWDNTIKGNPTGALPGASNINPDDGYGLSGAIHSKRQFPCGLFVTKIKHDFSGRGNKTNAHWDAWWAESNNPFSRYYGKKTLFMPNGGESRSRRGMVFENGRLTTVADRALNGEQVYEFDMYEWVSNNATQWQVIHCWEWYGGYPGNEQRENGGDVQLWSTRDNLRNFDRDNVRGLFSNSYSDNNQAQNKNWFYLVMLVTPDKIQMWNAPIRATLKESLNNAVKTSTANKTNGAFENNTAFSIWDANSHAPIQVKYSSELGDWGNKHHLIYNNRTTLTKENPDIMYSEFFAFYAWDSKDKWYSGKTFDKAFID